MAGAGDYLAAGIGRRVVLYDRASANRLAVMGQSPPLDGEVAALAVYGQTVYVGLNNDGLVALDISNPQVPAVVWQDPSAAWDLQVDGNYLLVAAGYQGLRIFNLVNPHKPALAAEKAINGGITANLDIQGDRAFVTVESKLVIVNTSNKTAPVTLGNYEFGNRALDVAVSGVTAFLGVLGEGVIALDVGNPASPKEIGRFADIYTGDNVYLHHHYLIVSNTSVLDVGNPSNMRQVAYRDDHGFNDISPYQDVLAMAGGNNGILLLDPEALPNLKTQLVDQPKSYAAMAISGRVLAAGTVDNGIQLFDISNPIYPQPRGTMPFDNYIADIAMSEHNALVALDSGVHIVSTSNLDAPREIGHLAVGFAEKVLVNDNLAYVAASNDGLLTVDISDPTNPQIINKIPMYVRSAAMSDGLLYIIERDPTRVHVASLSDPRQPVIVSTFPEQIIGVTAVGKTAYARSENGFLIYDMTNPAAPLQKGPIKGPTTFSAIAFANEARLFIGDIYSIGVYDISTDPFQPHFKAKIDPKGGWSNLMETDRAIFMSGYISGLSTRIWLEAEEDTILPEGGTFESADGKVVYQFSEGGLADYPVFRHVNLDEGNLLSSPPQPLAGILFSAGATQYGGPPVMPIKPYRMEVHYDQTDLGFIEEDSLALYRYDGSRWNRELTAETHPQENTISAEPDAFGTWALTGVPAQSAYLPLVSAPLEQPDLIVLGMEVTQVVQNLSNSLPLVSGRRTVARIHVRAEGRQPVDNVPLILEGTRDGAPLPGLPLSVGDWAIFNKHDRANINNSFNITLPDSWTKGQVHLTTRLNPDLKIGETNFGNNKAEATVQFQDKPPLDVTLVPIAVQLPSIGGNCPAPQVDESLVADVQRLFPVNELQVTIRQPVSMEGNSYDQLLPKLAGVKSSDGAPESTVYYGVVGYRDGVYGLDCVDGLIAGLGYIGRRASVGANVRDIMAHETGHNLGLKHAPCGDPDNVDKNYPYANASIGQYGYDILDDVVWSPSLPDYAKDFMSYCSPGWNSDYNYLKLFKEQQFVAEGDAPAEQPSLLIRASFNQETGSFVLAPLYKLNDRPTPLPKESEFTIELRSESGAVIATYPVTADRAEEEGMQISDIVVVLPLPVGQEAAAVQLKEDGRLLAEGVLEPVADPGAQPRLSRNKVGEGLTLTWGASDRPVLVRFVPDDGGLATTYAIDLRGGSMAIPETAELASSGSFEVIFGDSRSEGVQVGWAGGK